MVPSLVSPWTLTSSTSILTAPKTGNSQPCEESRDHLYRIQTSKQAISGLSECLSRSFPGTIRAIVDASSNCKPVLEMRLPERGNALNGSSACCVLVKQSLVGIEKWVLNEDYSDWVISSNLVEGKFFQRVDEALIVLRSAADEVDGDLWHRFCRL